MSFASTLSIPDLAAVAGEFALPGRCVGGEPYGSGHINDTFVVTYDQAGIRVRYIFQRINSRIFNRLLKKSVMD